MRAPALFAALALAPLGLAAEATFYPAASVGLPILGMDVGPRHLAMGEASTALEGDVFSLRSNPSGLAAIGGDLQVTLLHDEFVPGLDLRREYLGLGRATDYGTLALDLQFVNYGRFDNRNSDGSFNYYNSGLALAGGLGWAKRTLDGRLDLGAALEAHGENLGFLVYQQYLGSLGAGWRLKSGRRLAASVTQVGVSSARAGRTPASAQLGGAADLFGGAVTAAADFCYPFYGDPSLRAGLEWRLAGVLALRGGWRQALGAAPGGLLSGPTAGLGGSYGRLSLDYAFTPTELGPSHRVALTLSLPERLFKAPPLVIQAGGGTAAARANQDLGEQLLKDGRMLDALVAFKQCAQNDQANTACAARVENLSAELEQARAAGEKDKEVVALMKRYFEEGLKLYKDGELKRAIAAWEIALQVDKRNAEVLAKIKEARQELEGRTAGRMEEAAKALDLGDLAGSARMMREVLQMDPDHAGAKARLEALAPKFLAEIRRLHRQGIDLYVDLKVDEALAVWRKALAMDPGDPENLKRDIERAKRLKEFRSN